MESGGRIRHPRFETGLDITMKEYMDMVGNEIADRARAIGMQMARYTGKRKNLANTIDVFIACLQLEREIFILVNAAKEETARPWKQGPVPKRDVEAAPDITDVSERWSEVPFGRTQGLPVQTIHLREGYMEQEREKEKEKEREEVEEIETPSTQEAMMYLATHMEPDELTDMVFSNIGSPIMPFQQSSPPGPTATRETVFIEEKAPTSQEMMDKYLETVEVSRYGAQEPERTQGEEQETEDVYDDEEELEMEEESQERIHETPSPPNDYSVLFQDGSQDPLDVENGHEEYGNGKEEEDDDIDIDINELQLD